MTDEVKALSRKRFNFSGRMFFPNLLEPQEFKGQSPKYSARLAWKPDDKANVKATAELREHITKMAKAAFGSDVDVTKIANPVHRHDTYERQDGKPNPDYMKPYLWVNAKANLDYPPKVVDAKYNKVEDKAEVYSGRNCVFSINFFSYSHSGRRGISASINGVVLLTGGEKEGGYVFDAKSEFGEFSDIIDKSDANATEQALNGASEQNSPW